MKRRSVLLGGLSLCAVGMPTPAQAVPPKLRITWPGEVHEFDHVSPVVDATKVVGSGAVALRNCIMAAAEWASDELALAREVMSRPAAVLLPARRYEFPADRIGLGTWNEVSGPPDPRGVRALVFDASGQDIPTTGRGVLRGFSFYPTPPVRSYALRNGLYGDVADWIPRIEVDGLVVLQGTWRD